MNAGANDEVFLGRQPVIDAERNLFGYELLYRSGPDAATAFDDPDAATRCVMERVLLQWGMEHVVDDHFGLVNANASLVVHGLHRAMPPEGMIIEVRECEPFDDDTLAALQQARYEGYHFALDNVGRLSDLENSRLLPLASIVKVELTTAHDAEIRRLIETARDRSPGVLVVAEKVESVEDFKRCIDHGFDLFQGYYVDRPEVLRRPARPTSRRSTAELAAILETPGNADDGIDTGRLESVIAADPTLAFRLLAAVDANAFGLSCDVSSLEHAMGLLGPAKLLCLAELLATTSEVTDDVRHVEQGAVRAQMASRLLEGSEQRGSGVTVALLSTTDSLYGTSIGELLEELPVTAGIRSALLHGQGTLGITIDLIRACEQGDTATIADLAPGRVDELVALHRAALDDNLCAVDVDDAEPVRH